MHWWGCKKNSQIDVKNSSENVFLMRISNQIWGWLRVPHGALGPGAGFGFVDDSVCIAPRRFCHGG